MSLVIKGQFGLIVDAVREKRPVIHHLTNYVTAGDCANITLCAGASPVMADEAEEVVEITSNADALVLNLGTIAKAKMQAMETAAAAALGIVIMGQAAELAAGFMETKDGPGMFKTRLFDGVYHVTTKWNVLHLDLERKQ